MKMHPVTKLVILLAAFALAASLPLCLAGCGAKPEPPEPAPADPVQETPQQSAPGRAPAQEEPDAPLLRTATKDEVRMSLTRMGELLSLEERHELNEAFAAFARDIMAANPAVSSPEVLDAIMLQALREFEGMTAAQLMDALPKPEETAAEAPSPPAGPEAAHHAQNSLKMWGLVCKMYAGEQPGERFPALSAQPGVLFFDISAIYPEYFNDPGMLVNPAHPRAEELGQRVGEAFESLQGPALLGELERIGAESYYYTGFALVDEMMGLAFAESYARRMAEGQPDDEAGMDVDLQLNEPHLIYGQMIYRLREGIERFFITDINDPASGARAKSTIPVLFERPASSGADINVLFLDGHVATVADGTFPNTEAFLRALEELKALRQ